MRSVRCRGQSARGCHPSALAPIRVRARRAAPPVQHLRVLSLSSAHVPLIATALLPVPEIDGGKAVTHVLGVASAAAGVPLPSCPMPLPAPALERCRHRAHAHAELLEACRLSRSRCVAVPRSTRGEAVPHLARVVAAVRPAALAELGPSVPPNTSRSRRRGARTSWSAGLLKRLARASGAEVDGRKIVAHLAGFVTASHRVAFDPVVLRSSLPSISRCRRRERHRCDCHRR